MNIIKQDVAGIDIQIQKMQTTIYGKLLPVWNVNDSTFTMYGRAYRNQSNDGYIPEVYTGNNEYKDSYFDDTLSGSAFWGVGDIERVDKSASTTADVFLIFMVNLAKIKPGKDRNDEQARVDVEQICMSRDYGFYLNAVVTGIDQVFKEYGGYKKTKGIEFRDMHPWHCFRLNFKLTYNIYDCK